MFTERELETTKDILRKKKSEVLDSRDGSDLDYLRKLRTLIKLESAVTERLKNERRNQ